MPPEGLTSIIQNIQMWGLNIALLAGEVEGIIDDLFNPGHNRVCGRRTDWGHT